MKRMLILMTLLVAAGNAGSQSLDAGGLGYFMTGPNWIYASRIDDYLARPEVLGPSYQPYHLGMMIGGEGFGLADRFLIGGGGYGTGVFSVQSDSGAVTEFQGGGYFKAGYLFWSKATMFAHANLGIGFMGHTFEIRNDRAVNGIYFDQEFPVMPGQERIYSYGGMSLDPGVGFKMVLAKPEGEKLGGVVVGVDVGCIINLPYSDWYSDESVYDYIYGPPVPGVSTALYIRFIFGGGGFKNKAYVTNDLPETPMPRE